MTPTGSIPNPSGTCRVHWHGEDRLRLHSYTTGEEFDVDVAGLFQSLTPPRSRALVAEPVSRPLPGLPDYTVVRAGSGLTYTKRNGRWYLLGSTTGTFRFASDDELWRYHTNAKVINPFNAARITNDTLTREGALRSLGLIHAEDDR